MKHNRGDPVSRIMTAIACVVMICGALLSMPTHAAQTEYYFDHVNGADENDGTKTKPWKTLAKLDGLSLNPGDNVLFARGECHAGVIQLLENGRP